MWLKKLIGRKAYQEADWVEIPDEDLWQDGEITAQEVKDILYLQVVQQGVWKLIKEVE